MKKNILSIFTLAALLSLGNAAIAQYSIGGTPISFSNNFEAKNSINYISMPSFDLAAMQAEDAINDQSKGPFRFGYNHMVNLNMTNSGKWTTLSNGDRMWQLGVRSKDAKSI